MQTYTYTNTEDNLDDAVKFIAAACRKYGSDGKNTGQHMVYIRKLLEFLTMHYDQEQTVTVEVIRFLGEIKVRLFYKGEKIQEDALLQYAMDSVNPSIGEIRAMKLRQIYEKCFGTAMVSHKHGDSGMNVSSVTVRKSTYKKLILLLCALAAGVGAGLLIRALVPETAGAFLAENIFNSISKVFVNCVKMLIAPLMFFTISSSISAYSDLSSLGRMGLKLVLRYLFNAVLATAVAVGIVLLMRPGVGQHIASLESVIASAGQVEQTVSQTNVSVLDTVMDFFPSNFFGAFVDSSMMQIIFISALLGIAAGMLDMTTRESIHKFLAAGNRLFCRMVDILMLVLPVSVFCSMANTVITMGAETLVLLFRWLLALVLAFAVMTVIYILLTWLFAHVSPRVFLQHYGEAIISTFAMGSCNASLPLCMSTMENKMGVEKKTVALGLPIGASIHCASNCLFYIISAFFLANLYYGTELSPLAYPMLFFSVFVLGIGAPSISGAGPICVAMLLPQLGVPMGLITLIIGLDPLVSLFKSACSCTEDAAVTLNIANGEKTINREVLKN